MFTNEKYHDIIRENLDLIDVNQMSPYILKFNNTNREFMCDVKTVDDLLNKRQFTLRL